MDRSRVTPIGVLEGLPEEELDAVARHANEREFSVGDTLMTEGDFGFALYLIEEGSADIVAQGEKIAEAGPGDVVGEVAVLAGRRNASVLATSPVRAIEVFKRDAWALESEAPEATRRLRSAMEGHIPQEDAEQPPA